MGELGGGVYLLSSENRKQLEQHPVAERYPGRGPAANTQPLVAPERRVREATMQASMSLVRWGRAAAFFPFAQWLTALKHRTCTRSTKASSQSVNECVCVWSGVLSPDSSGAVDSL